MSSALQAGNLLREALGDLQTSEAILAKDQRLAGMQARHVAALTRRAELPSWQACSSAEIGPGATR